MSIFNLSLAAALLVSSAALAQTTPSTTSGPVSGSGATTSGTTPASVGPAQYTTKAYRQEMRNDRATAPKRDRKKSMRMKTTSPDGDKMKPQM